ncbi:DedA family protein [Marinicaulis aureus]|uniref:DedA family protein n=1 Tax=Hyphococcus aureus TaxID=2666033 RepID=A0ABW1L1P9_9PROT
MFGFEAGDMATMSWWVLFGALFLTPFLQEDFGVILAATASLAGTAPTVLLIAAILTGLVASDAWKYWMGRLARRYQWAHKFAEKPGVSVAGDLIRKEFLQTMLTARFVPGTRIPTYIAAGFFKAYYPKYVLTLVFTASLYIGVVFSLFHTVGAVAGEEAIVWMPLVTITLLAAYILFRWINHRRKKEGVMTPLTKERDHPMPGMPGFEGTPLEEEEEE